MISIQSHTASRKRRADYLTADCGVRGVTVAVEEVICSRLTRLIADRQDLRTPGRLELRSHISATSRLAPEPKMTTYCLLVLRGARIICFSGWRCSRRKKNELSKYIMTRLQKHLSLFLVCFVFLSWPVLDRSRLNCRRFR